MLKKIEVSKINIENSLNKLICPICLDTMYVENISLKCKNGHCFDISSKGYINLCMKNRNDKIYNVKLFNSRKNFIISGYYAELHNLIAKIINSKSGINSIIDMGSGDGTHDNLIQKKIENKNTIIFGVDISKDGIILSSEYIYDNFIPILADLNNLPFANNSIDVILNILSPSNEKEMKRVLKNDGIIIKVTPKKEYLYELREALNIKEYENEEIIERNIKNNYIVEKKFEINTTHHIDSNDFNNLLTMTPLSNNKNIVNEIDQITIALNIYLLKPKWGNN